MSDRRLWRPEYARVGHELDGEAEMKAWVVRRNGPPDSMTFEDLPDPGTPPGMLRIAVEAAGVNFFDSLLVAGTYQQKPDLPFVPGAEVAGVVVGVPRDSGFEAGDRVLARVQADGLGGGGYAELAHARPEDVLKIPDSMSFEEAAAFFINYQTGWFGLNRRAQLQPGEFLLVHGAAGGVGSAAVQLGKAAGAVVIASVGSAQKAAVCRRLGADLVVQHHEQDVAQAVKDFTRGHGADVVYDPVGGDAFERSTKCIAFEGRLVVVGFASGQIPQARANHVLVKNYSVVGLHWGLYNERLSPRRVRPRHDHRHARVRLLPDRPLDGYRAQVRHPQPLGRTLGLAVVEHVVLLAAAVAHEPAHVLDQPQSRHVQPPEHLQRLEGDPQRRFLRGADDGDARERHRLGEGQRRVAGAGRQVDDQVVELIPPDVAQHLLDRSGDQGTPPHHRLV